MLRRTLRLLLPLLFALAGNAAAAEWPALEDARKNSARDDKPMFALVISTGPHRQDENYPVLRNRAPKDEDARGFLLCTVNLYEEYSPTDAEKAQGHRPYRKNAKLEAVYGGVGACCVIAPGAIKPLWKLLLGAGKDDVFKQARQAYANWHDPIAKAEKELKDNRELRKDPAALVKLAKLWTTGFASTTAIKQIDDAVKLLPREQRSGAQAEEWLLLAASSAVDGLDWAVAARRAKEFLDEFKQSTHRDTTRLLRATALSNLGDTDGAMKELDAISESASKEVQEAAAKLRETAAPGK